MYAVIKTGGKQYRVQAGDVLVVEKLAGEPGDNVNFGEVLMIGDGEAITVGAPLVDGAAVAATLIETRKGEKIKVFKKIRRQGYRRTQGHRQTETVLRVVSVAGGGKTDKWDGTVDLTTKAELNARSRNLKFEAPVAADAAPVAKAKKAPKAVAAPAAPAAPKAAAKAEAAPAPAKEAAPKKAAAPKTAKAEGDAAPKKPAAPKKAAAKKEDGEA